MRLVRPLAALEREAQEALPRGVVLWRGALPPADRRQRDLVLVWSQAEAGEPGGTLREEAYGGGCWAGSGAPARDEPAGEGLATLVAWGQTPSPAEGCDIDVDLDGALAPRGLARL